MFKVTLERPTDVMYPGDLCVSDAEIVGYLTGGSSQRNTKNFAVLVQFNHSTFGFAHTTGFTFDMNRSKNTLRFTDHTPARAVTKALEAGREVVAFQDFADFGLWLYRNNSYPEN